MKIVSRKGIKTLRRYSSLENPIYDIESPDFIRIPFLDCSIEDFNPRFNEGDYVPQFSVLGTNNDGFAIFAPNCGRYEGVEYYDHQILGKTLVVNFTVEHGMSMNPFKPIDSIAPDSDEVVFAAKRSGIIDEIDNVPLYQKLLDIREKKIGVLIADAIEDECYETSCFAQLIELGEDIGKGIELAAIACGVWDYKIAVTRPREYSKGIRKTYCNAEVIFADGKYPVHHAVREGFSKKDVEFIGAGACAQLCRAMAEGACQTTCVITVDGDCVKRPANLRVAIGTPVSYLIEACRLSTEPENIIIGDMLNGKVITDPMTPVVPSMKCILAMNTMLVAETYECTKCGRCANDCPENLLPFKLKDAIEKGENKYIEQLQISKCIECGVCSLVCPSGIDIKSVIAAARAGMDYREFNTVDSLDEYETPIGEINENQAVEDAAMEMETDISADANQNAIDAIEVLSAINNAENEENDQSVQDPQTRYTYTPLHDEGIDDLVESTDANNTVISFDDEYKERDYSEYLNFDFEAQDITETSGSNDQNGKNHTANADNVGKDYSNELAQTLEANTEDSEQSAIRIEDIKSNNKSENIKSNNKQENNTSSTRQSDSGFTFDLKDIKVASIADEENISDREGYMFDFSAISREIQNLRSNFKDIESDTNAFNNYEVKSDKKPEVVNKQNNAASIHTIDKAAAVTNESPIITNDSTTIINEAAEETVHSQRVDSEPLKIKQDNHSDDSFDELLDFDSFFKSINEDIEKSNKALQSINDIMNFTNDHETEKDSGDIESSDNISNQHQKSYDSDNNSRNDKSVEPENVNNNTSGSNGYDFMAHAGLSSDTRFMQSFGSYIGKSDKPTASNNQFDDLHSNSKINIDKNVDTKPKEDNEDIVSSDVFDDISSVGTDDFFDYILKLDSYNND